jgi:hypothetical protein
MRQRLRRMALTALTFVTTGPLAGLLAYLGIAIIAGGATDPAGALAGALWLLPFAYLLGGGPALLTGALAAAALAPGWRPAYLLGAAALGGIVAGTVALLDAEPVRLDDGVANFALIGAIGGLGAAMASAALEGRTGARRRPDSAT